MWLSPFERRVRFRRRLMQGAAFCAALALTIALDGWLIRHLAWTGPAGERAAGRDWYRLLRVCGYLPTWLVIASVVQLAASAGARDSGGLVRRPTAPSACWLALLSGALSGGLAEVLKLVVRRHRPPDMGLAPGETVLRFDWFGQGVSGLGLGTASSHAAVAFGAAFVLGRVYPRAAPVLILLACGTAYTRLLKGDHYVSDVLVGAGLSYAVSIWLTARRPVAPARPGRAEATREP